MTSLSCQILEILHNTDLELIRKPRISWLTGKLQASEVPEHGLGPEDNYGILFWWLTVAR